MACPVQDPGPATSGDGSSTSDEPDPSSSTGLVDPTITSTLGGSADGTTTSSGSEGMTTAMTGSSTGPEAQCGNDMVEGDEICDGVDLAGEDCVSQGFDRGELACARDCLAYDPVGCIAFSCGNGIQEGPEVCDGGDLAGATCVSEGFDSGQLSCAIDCLSFELAGCGTCGNVIVDGDEACDDIALFGQTCESQGFDSGDLLCAADCLGFDTTGCGICGNGVIDGAESCDGMMLGGETCLSLGLDDGDLACNPVCDFNLAGCGDLRLFFSQDSNANGLYELSIFDGSAVAVGPSGVGAGTVGLTYNAATGNLLGTEPFELLEIQLDGTGFVSLGVVTAEGLGYDPVGGALYGALNGMFFQLDPANGMNLANLAAPGYDMEGLAVDPNNGIVYGVGDSTLLSAYDIAAGSWAVVGDTGLDWDSGGLAYNPVLNVLYAGATAQGTGLYTIDPVTAVPTLVGNNGLGITLGGGLATVY